MKRKGQIIKKWLAVGSVIFSLVFNLVVPSSSPANAGTFTKTWTTQGDFDNNTVTGQGATTKTNVDTTSSAGDVKLSTVGSDQSFTESFTANTNIDTANSVAEISGGSLAQATGTATDLSSKLLNAWGTISGALSAKTDYATGSYPYGVAISADGASVYVTNYDSATVSKYPRNTSTGALSAKTDYATGTNPIGVAISADGASVYVA
ncbi:beta-propeller fold lactonase family protein, partial [Candidatus Azambacteria bacterium]|nr:beta-propeller fold lactonase family protein [Candidatus Azambacteria bacterium]